jgi:hypothetical protein
MSIESVEDLARVELAGRVTRAVLDAMKEAVRPEISNESWMRSGQLSCEPQEAARRRSWSINFPGKLHQRQGRDCAWSSG